MTNPQPPRPWDVRELQAGDARRLRVRGVARVPDGVRVVRRVPDPPKPEAVVWSEVTRDADTRAILTQLVADGFEVRGVVDGRAYLQLQKHLVVLVVSEADPSVIVRLVHGHRVFTARQAVQWLTRGAP